MEQYFAKYLSEPAFKQIEKCSDLDADFIRVCRTRDACNISDWMKVNPRFDVNFSSGYPLRFVIDNRNLDVAKVLILNYGADVNVENGYPIRSALFQSEFSFVKFLITEGKANVNIDNMLPFRIAVFNNFSEIVDLMISHGANISGVDTKILSNILFMACSHGLFNVVKFLSDSGFNVHKTKALNCARDHEHVRIVEFLSTKLCDDESHDELVICKRCYTNESIPGMTTCQSCSVDKRCDGCSKEASDVKVYKSNGDLYWFCDACEKSERCYGCRSTFSMGSLCDMCREDSMY